MLSERPMAVKASLRNPDKNFSSSGARRKNKERQPRKSFEDKRKRKKRVSEKSNCEATEVLLQIFSLAAIHHDHKPRTASLSHA